VLLQHGLAFLMRVLEQPPEHVIELTLEKRKRSIFLRAAKPHNEFIVFTGRIQPEQRKFLWYPKQLGETPDESLRDAGSFLNLL
jgi:hypothetical protein